MKTTISSILMIVALCSIGDATMPLIARARALPKVDLIKNQKLVMGAGCFYNFASGKNGQTILADGDGKPVMNLDGRDLALKRIGTRSTKKLFTTTYAINNIRIKVENVPNGKIDSTAIYKSKITISQGNKSQVIRASGYCGC